MQTVPPSSPRSARSAAPVCGNVARRTCVLDLLPESLPGLTGWAGRYLADSRHRDLDVLPLGRADESAGERGVRGEPRLGGLRAQLRPSLVLAPRDPRGLRETEGGSARRFHALAS